MLRSSKRHHPGLTCEEAAEIIDENKELISALLLNLEKADTAIDNIASVALTLTNLSRDLDAAIEELFSTDFEYLKLKGTKLEHLAVIPEEGFTEIREC